jgi:RimJ/RimL family protein N-acetyltransferase
MQASIIKAQESDFKLIAELAKSIWQKHYVPIIGEEQVSYMLSTIYSKNSLTEQTQAKKHVFYLIKEVDNIIGFVSISAENKTDYWIHKFYVLQNNQNKGIGSIVFNEVLKQMNHPKTIRLTVNRQNFKSINFYFKLGFKIEKVADFDIGNGYFMNDFVMLWKAR